MSRATKSFEARFWPKIEFDPFGGCWLYSGYLDKNGYGLLVGYGEYLVHRASFRHFVGPIGPEERVSNLCGIRSCANPAHWAALTPLENVRQSQHHNAVKEFCPSGHPYSAENTRIWRGQRRCKACAVAFEQTPEYRRNKRALEAKYRAKRKLEKQNGDRAHPTGPGREGPPNL